MKSLRSTGSATASPHRPQMAQAAAEKRLVGQHGNRVGSGSGIRPGQRRRIKIRAAARLWTATCVSPPPAAAPSPRRRKARGQAARHGRRLGALHQRHQGRRPLPPSGFGPRFGEDSLQNHAARPPDSRRSASSASYALPESMASAAMATPSRKLAAESGHHQARTGVQNDRVLRRTLFLAFEAPSMMRSGVVLDRAAHDRRQGGPLQAYVLRSHGKLTDARRAPPRRPAFRRKWKTRPCRVRRARRTPAPRPVRAVRAAIFGTSAASYTPKT